MTTASVLIVMIVATAVGGLIGMVLAGSVNLFVLATALAYRSARCCDRQKLCPCAHGSIWS